ncbi:DUF952 domain-containing protein [Pseudomarimonas salicorniae]|uniref:DUF952 domain-containing protein n=1 Tax=Pseudomarimonas salicorniae TaxID=2933270 RepID=A0ABT0GI54_9GAMM|nr:DUF952 domain-containing protein [Lysobacter sp. CAU 1642]MCK7594231.1 DUF952 domain-containing protein [Lysobacter sp. CAU 1642]
MSGSDSSPGDGAPPATEAAAAAVLPGVEASSRSGPLFHFAHPDDWARAQRSGEYVPADYAREGFIHCATAEQVPGVVERHLRGGGPRIRLRLDPEALRTHLQFEWSAASQDLYPHLFAPIPLAAVLEAQPFDPDA